jgi:hypothetical protein
MLLNPLISLIGMGLLSIRTCRFAAKQSTKIQREMVLEKVMALKPHLHESYVNQVIQILENNRLV